MAEFWSYQKKKYIDRRGTRWHFVVHDIYPPVLPAGVASFGEAIANSLYEVFFRDDDWKIFGCVRFEKRKDNPYSHEKLLDKLTNDSEFRTAHLAPDSKGIWRRSWK